MARTTNKVMAKRSEAMFAAWERGLNPEQLEVVRHDTGPCRVLALAGSGKTESLSRRLARMVASGIDPDRILAVTFTKKGADEMEARITRKFEVEGVRVGTWHSLCLQILREDRTRWGDWQIDDKNRAKVVLKDVLGWKGMDWKGADTNAVNSFVGRCKANLHDPDSEGAAAMAGAEFGYQASKVLQAFQRYNDALEEKEMLTFDDFLVFAARHLEDEDTRRQWAARWDHLLCDEVQDNNGAQQTLAEMLARDHRNYMAIGDCNQAIYAFRGSTPKYLATFEQDWPGARTIVLPRNYRSGRGIIAAANGILAKAKSIDGIEMSLAMIGERDLDGEVSARTSETLEDEAAQFAGWAKEKIAAHDARPSDFYCLFRVNAQSRAIEEALLRERLPYVVVGGVSFYERREVRDLLAYLRIGSEHRWSGSTADVKRCINAPFRFLGAKFVERVMAAGEDGVGLNWPAIVREVAEGERIQSRQKASAEEWASIVEGIKDAIREAAREDASDEQKHAAKPSVILDGIVRSTRYLEWIKKEEGEESVETSGVANVREMIRVAERFPSTKDLLDYVDETIRASQKQRDDKQAGGNRIVLMSVHRAKGLEAKHVWIAGFNEMILPHAKGDLEEERRIAYVAVTRARDSLVLSYVRSLATRAGIKDAHPSRFLRDSGVTPDFPQMFNDGPESGQLEIDPGS